MFKVISVGNSPKISPSALNQSTAQSVEMSGSLVNQTGCDWSPVCARPRAWYFLVLLLWCIVTKVRAFSLA